MNKSSVEVEDATEGERAAPTLSPNARFALEVAGCVLILIAGLVPRMRDFGAGFDREFEGFQGAFFALSAVNYERLGVGRYLGYPVQNIDELGQDELGTPSVTLYANHPPAVPLVAWLAAKTMGPSGWNTAWQDGRAPEGLEPALRFPFLLAHLACLVLAYLAVRAAAGPQRALIALAVLVATPVSILYATLINYENPALAFVFAAALFHVRYLKSGRRSDLVGYGLSALFGCATTFFHLFFLPFFFVQAFLRDKRRAFALALAATAGLLVPLGLHAGMSARAFGEIGASPSLLSERVGQMLAPLVDGSIPVSQWASFQVERSLRFLSEPIFALAALGVLLAAIAGLRSRKARDDKQPIELTLPLLGGGLLLLFVMYRHTADGWNGGDGQVPFLMYLLPGVATACALFFDRLAGPLAKLRGGLAPLVVAVSLVALPGLERANSLRRPLREPGPRDDSSLTEGPAAPLPETMGAELAELIPAGEFAIYPRVLGLTPAHLYYAWRTLLPVDPSDPSSINYATAKLAERGRDAWLLLPRSAEGELAVMSAALFDTVQTALPGLHRERPDREVEHWLAWRIASE